MGRIKIAIQKEGRLSESSLRLIEQIGASPERGSRSFVIRCKKFRIDLLMLRDDDIPNYVDSGACDFGIVGDNVLLESGISLETLVKLPFGQCELALLADDSFQLDQLQTLNNRRIATSHPQILSQFLKANEIQAQLVNLSGSVELAPRMNLADLVCDLVSTGNTAKLNGLTQMRTIFKSQAVLVSKNKFSSIESELKEEFLLRVQAAISAQKLKYLMMNIPQTEKSFFVNMLPAARSPTILPLSDERYAALQVVLSEDEVWKIFPSLKRMGATDIILTEVVGYLK